MKTHWKATVIWQDKTETHDFASYYEIVHFIFDIIVFRIKKESIIIKLEIQDEQAKEEITTSGL